MSERDGVLIGADGRRIAYLERGPTGGTTALYLHGMPGSRHEQRLIPDAVLDRFGVRLVSCDRPGYGATDPLAGDRIARSRDVFTVADHLGVERFPLMAVSAGGSYALTVAAAAPDRVERVVLAGAQMPYDDESAIATLLADQLALLPFLRDGRNELVDVGATDFRAKVLTDPWSLFESAWATLSAPERAFLEQPEVRATFERNVVEGLRSSAEGLVADLVTWPHPFEINVADVGCPIAAVHGQIDDWEPLANLRRILGLVSDVDLIVLEDRNHLGPLLLPDLLMSLLITGAQPAPTDASARP
jgi:pimeloyl-ACP methyl ester carboxylesterase